MSHAQVLEAVQRMVDSFAADVEALQAAVADGRTPDMARRALAAALTYVLERFDLIPDHLEGLGRIDDAAVLRLCAKHAVSYGADDAALRRLAGESADLSDLFDDLLGPLEEHVNRLTFAKVQGKTPADLLVDPESRMQLWRDLAQRLKDYRSVPLVAVHGDAESVVKLVRRMVRARLKKAGLVG